jgi:hypothetical protein
MVRGFGRLPFIRRQRVSTPSDAPAVDDAPIDPDSAPLGPPILLPATIFRQVLVDETELTPAWARPRVAAASATRSTASTADLSIADGAPSTDKPLATKRARRPKAAGAPAVNRAASAAKRSPSTRKRTNSA